LTPLLLIRRNKSVRTKKGVRKDPFLFKRTILKHEKEQQVSEAKKSAGQKRSKELQEGKAHQ